MTVAQSQDFQGAANAGRLAFLDTGAGNATIQIYGTARPAAGAAAGAAPLVTVVLAKPCGTVDNGLLVLASQDPAGDLITTSGTATWARFVNGAGTWAFDADVSVEGGAGEVQFPGTTLFAGGRAPLSTSTIG